MRLFHCWGRGAESTQRKAIRSIKRLDLTLTRIYPSKWINFCSKSIKWAQDHEITCVFLIFFYIERRMLIQMLGFLSMQELKMESAISWDCFIVEGEERRVHREKLYDQSRDWILHWQEYIHPNELIFAAKVSNRVKIMKLPEFFLFFIERRMLGFLKLERLAYTLSDIFFPSNLE
jgi:hypothetical protein